MNKFIFFYSPSYEFYNYHINKNLNDYFTVESILIDDLKNDNKNHTYLDGVSIKIELIIKKISENMNKYIIFSDATIFINSNNVFQLNQFFNDYKNNDLCFADNDGKGNLNIGLILIKCNKKTLLFFKNVLYDLIKSRSWDQYIINHNLKNYNDKYKIKFDIFDNTKIICGSNFNLEYKNTYLIYKSFITHNSDIIINFNNRLDIFKNAGLISDEDYYNYYKQNNNKTCYISS